MTINLHQCSHKWADVKAIKIFVVIAQMHTVQHHRAKRNYRRPAIRKRIHNNSKIVTAAGELMNIQMKLFVICHWFFFLSFLIMITAIAVVEKESQICIMYPIHFRIIKNTRNCQNESNEIQPMLISKII